MINVQKQANILHKQIAAFGVPVKKKAKKQYTHSSFQYKTLGSRPLPWASKPIEKKKKTTIKSPYTYESLKIKDGNTPVKGVDYFTASDIEEIKSAVYARVKDEIQPVDEESVIARVLDDLKGKMSINDLRDVEEFTRRTRDGLVTKYRVEELMHGGGSTSSGITIETPIGTINGINTTFVVTHTPQYIIIDGITYFENNGYTLSILTVTTNVPPTGFIRSAY